MRLTLLRALGAPFLLAALNAQPVAASAQPPASPNQAEQTVIVVLSTPCPQGPACPAQGPVVAEVEASGGSVVGTTSLVDTVTARVAPAVAKALAGLPGVAQVVPDALLPAPAPSPVAQVPARALPVGGPGARLHGHGPGSPLCGTERHPELDPEALQQIGATEAESEGYDGAGVTVAFLADGLSPSNPDLQRNPAFGPAGSPVVSSYLDFSGDGTAAPTNGAEAFGDASSIAAQGNVAYNLSQYVNPAQAARLPAGGCWIRVVGDAPGADLMALKVFAQFDDTTTSGFLQAVQYAVDNGAKVINESFGSDNFPDTSLDVIREADDAAVAAGVTVVASSGDAGSTSTIGSPASDPQVISVGATTSFRAYAQADFGGFDNPVVGNGRYLSGNISSLSSGGFTQAGNTVDLVAPGDLNWALCSTDTATYSGCADTFGGTDIGVQLFGGTSEAAPLTAGAAADVIQAYASHHGGVDPSPALVKEILMSTATDIGAPATEQGAGLLNIAAAVRLAASLPVGLGSGSSVGAGPAALGPGRAVGGGGTAPACHLAPSCPRCHPGPICPRCHLWPVCPAGTGAGLLVSPNQVNFVAPPGTPEATQVTLTNPGDVSQLVRLSTRALDEKVYDSGVQQFVMNPASLTENSGTFPIWSGAQEVYQVENFTVPPVASGAGTRLEFSADYQDTNQTSLLHFALFEPDGTYAAYSLPQGLGDYGEVEVADPPPGTWTALFFTELDGATAGAVGTGGPVQWDASVYRYGPYGTVSPSSVFLPPGGTASVTLSAPTPASPGDTSFSLVVSATSSRGFGFSGAATSATAATPFGHFGPGQALPASPGALTATTTVPVTLRSTVPIGPEGGTFSGLLTGGNGRQGAEAETNTYFFQVPPGETDLDASVKLANDPGDQLIAYLVNPDGQTVGYSSNYTYLLGASGLSPGATLYTDIYHVAPEPGMWELILAWQNPVTGDELQEPFTGSVEFNRVEVSSDLPSSPSVVLPQLTSSAFEVTVTNTGSAPEAFFVDPRLTATATVALPNLNPAVTATSFTLPLPAGLSFPYYVVPPHTYELQANVTRESGSAPVTFDMSYFPGDPDVSPALAAPGAAGFSTGAAASLTLSGSPELSPGLWLVNPDEVGPYPPGGAPTDTASASVSAVTQAFDPTVTSSTGDFWQLQATNVLYLLPGESGTISVQVTPDGPVGSVQSGVLYVDDYVLASLFSTPLPDGDELAAIPYTYTVGSPAP